MHTREPEREVAIVDANGPDTEAVRLGMAWVLERVRAGGHDGAGVLVSGLDQIEHAAPHLGLDGQRLRRRRRATINGVEVAFVNSRSWPLRCAVPVLALWLDDDEMAKIDDMAAPAVCAVNWNNEAYLQVWKAAWLPVDLRSGQRDAPPSLPPTVVAALGDLTDRCNLATGISHPSDRDAAVEMLYILREAGEQLDSAAIRAWLTRNGWTSRGAAAVEDLASKVANRRGVARPRGKWRNDILGRWRDGS